MPSPAQRQAPGNGLDPGRGAARETSERGGPPPVEHRGCAARGGAQPAPGGRGTGGQGRNA
eukprot:2200211-Lingulodinium_polyedra.AAC.1